jgi:hypothetical protein
MFLFRSDVRFCSAVLASDVARNANKVLIIVCYNGRL